MSRLFFAGPPSSSALPCWLCTWATPSSLATVCGARNCVRACSRTACCTMPGVQVPRWSIGVPAAFSVSGSCLCRFLWVAGVGAQTTNHTCNLQGAPLCGVFRHLGHTTGSGQASESTRQQANGNQPQCGNHHLRPTNSRQSVANRSQQLESKSAQASTGQPQLVGRACERAGRLRGRRNRYCTIALFLAASAAV